jgi:hypothetical protein
VILPFSPESATRACALFLLALAGLAHAAPAPFAKPSRGPEHPPVLMSGWLEQRLPGNPSAITRRSDWEAFAATLGIKDVPDVNFRTHFLFVHLSAGYGLVGARVDGTGDLRAFGDFRALDEGGIAALLDDSQVRHGPRYLIQSFPRSAVKTVNGAPLPK